MSKQLAPAWEKGQSGNPNGRPKGTGRPVSRLRTLVKKLQAMEAKALKNIEDSVDGKEVDKQTLDTSKWVITTAVNVNRAATQEEQFKHELKKDAEDYEEEAKANGTTGLSGPKFTTSLIKDEEE